MFVEKALKIRHWQINKRPIIVSSMDIYRNE